MFKNHGGRHALFFTYPKQSIYSMEGASLKEKAPDALVRQRDVSECGVACLASIVKYHGEEIPLDTLWKLSDASTKGTTLQGLLEAAEAVGLEAGGYEADLETLSDLASPCVLHVTKGEGRQHYVVCYGTVDGKFLIGDPGSGVDELHPAMLAKRWQSRVLLTAEPTSDFEAQVAAAKGEAKEPTVEEEYRALGVDSTPFGLNQVLVETAGSDQPRLLPSGLGQILLSRDQFDTIENHAETCVRALSRRQNGTSDAEDGDGGTSSVSENQKQDVRRQLRRFVEEGLLTAKSDVREKVHGLQDETGDGPPPITSVCIPTAGRSDSLRRALSSYAQDTRGRDVPTRMVVMDDAEDSEERADTLAEVEELSDDLDEIDLFYADRDRRGAYAEDLADHAGIPVDVARFALLGNKEYANTYGAPRNGLLLHTVGELTVQVDDDTVADSALPPSTDEGLTLTSETIPREWWFYDDREALLSGVRSSEEQFLAVHEQLLGRTIGQCLSEIDDQEEPLRIGDIDAEFLEHVQDDTTVMLSFAGAMGDSGRLNMQMRLLSDDATFGRLTEHYDPHMETTEVLRAPTCPTITNSAGCVSMNVGIDNRAPMPPFMPVGQGEDHVFGLALRLCFHRGYRGYLPHSLFHDPQDERPRDDDVEFDGYGAYALTQHIMSAADEWLEADGKEALTQLGRYLEDVGSSSPSAFADYVERRARKALGQQIQSAERLLLRRPAAPSDWRKDIRQYLQSAKEMAQSDHLHVPEDLSGDAEENSRILQEVIRRYGTLLQHWSTLRAAAADLRDKGMGVAEKV